MLDLMQREQIKKQLRSLREQICFPIVNRGALWYEGLTDAQRDELAVWYRAWLDVTDTRRVPRMPSWLQNK